MATKRTPMLEQYFSIKEQHQDAVLFFQMGDFYEMFGDDAKSASKILDLTLTARGKGTDNEIPMCGIPLHAAGGYIAKLTRAGQKIAICDQMTEPDGKNLVKREVTKIVTPGTTFDDAILSQKQSNFLCAIGSDGKKFALGIVDATTGKFQVGLFKKLAELQDSLFRFNPSEIIYSNIDQAVVDSMSKQYYINQFSLPSWQQPKTLITDHFQTLGLEGFGLQESDLLAQVAANLLAYLQETQKSALGHIRNIEIYQTADHMLLDESTIRNLEIFHNQQTGQLEGGVVHSIDLTTTSMGGRLLRWWLAHPLIDESKLKRRHQAVELFVTHQGLRDKVRESLNVMCDLERLVGKVGTQRCNPRDLYNLKQTIKQMPTLRSALLTHIEKIPLIKSLYEKLHPHEDLLAEIEKVLINEPPVLLHDGGYIREGYNQELDEIRKISKSGKDWINEMQERERERTGVGSLKVKFNKVFGYYIEISKSNLSSVPDDYIRKQTLVNAERYITPELKEYEEKVLGAQDQILRLEEELFVKLREFVFAHVGTLQETAQALAQLDVLTSFAHLAVSRNFCKPVISKDSELHIEQGRHPVIEHLQSEPYVANDLLMNDSQGFILLTGPNMSGKSSFLRQNALIVLLAQIGSYVPAKSMKWGIVDRVFTRVGASDNLAVGRSTFMVEMQEAAYILNNATDKSLVILDELGRGTSTYDGLSLAWAITEYLHDVIKAKTLFATHYHELIEIIDELAKASNYSVAVAEDGEDVVFLHQVVAGGVNRSYGVEVAKLAGLPQNLILRAKDILTKLEKHAWENNTSERQRTLPLMPVAASQDHPVVEKLKDIDLNNMTPMQALETLNDLKQDIE